MINSIQSYEDAGWKAGAAVRNGDLGRFRHELRWFNAAVRLEDEADRKDAREAWDRGYKSVARPTPRPFV